MKYKDAKPGDKFRIITDVYDSLGGTQSKGSIWEFVSQYSSDVIGLQDAAGVFGHWYEYEIEPVEESMELKAGKCYVLRNGSVTEPLTYDYGTTTKYVFDGEVMVDGHLVYHSWTVEGYFSGSNTESDLDIVQEALEEKAEEENPLAQKIRDWAAKNYVQGDTSFQEESNNDVIQSLLEEILGEKLTCKPTFIKI